MGEPSPVFVMHKNKQVSQKRENLQKFCDGIIYFNPLIVFRQDGTLFRGDKYEGKILIDAEKGIHIDGNDMSPYVEEATISYEGSDNVLIFCASILNEETTHPIKDGIAINDDFISEMRKFGKYAIIFKAEDLSNHIRESLLEMKCDTAWGPVAYCDKKDYSQSKMLYKEKEELYGDAAIFFLKRSDQKIQNEWRFVIDNINPLSQLVRNMNGSLCLPIKPIPVTAPIDLDDPLNCVSP